MRGDEPSIAFAFVRPLAGTARADEPRRFRLPKKHACGTRPTRAKIRARFGERGPFSNRFRTPHLSCAHCFERRILPRVVLAPGDSLRANAGPATAKTSDSRTAPRRVMRSTKTEVRSTAVRLCELEDRSPRSPRWASRPRGTCAPKSTDALQLERACAFSTAPRCPA